MEFKEDCFAIQITEDSFICRCLDKINCEKCHFYRNDITSKKIENDIKIFSFNPYAFKKRV